MTIVDNLKKFKEKISAAVAVDEDLKRTIGVHLYSAIQEDDASRRILEERFNFLKDLSADQEFRELQSNLNNVIIQMMKIFSEEDVKQVQQMLDDSIPDEVKSRDRIDHYFFHVPLKIDNEYSYVSHTLPELHQLMTNQNNYNRLGDHLPLSIDKYDLSIIVHTGTIIRQYPELVNIPLTIIRSLNPSSHPDKSASFVELHNKYRQLYNKLLERLYFAAIKLHIHEFEDFILMCACVIPIKGLENFLNYADAHWENRQLEKIKKTCIEVIDDLILCLENGRSDRLIFKDSDGKYFYNKKEIEVSRTAFYFVAFDTLYNLKKEGGIAEYSELITVITAHGHQKKANPKSIRNALTNKGTGIFQHAKVAGKKLENKTLSNEPLIESVKNGIRFNNPHI